MGGVPAETPMVSGAAPTKAPFIGCLRDVLIEKDIVDFNSVIYHTGVEMNTCSVETVESGTSLGSDVTTGIQTVGGVRGAILYKLQSALNCFNLKWQLVEHAG